MPKKRKLPEGLEHLAPYDPATFPKPEHRPTVLEYDCALETPDHERERSRPMDDLEYADLLHRQELHALEAEKPVVHPLVAQVASMGDDDKQALRAALGAS